MLANRIKSVRIRNYRSIEDVTVDLDDLTVLVGANGSGKSNFLNALRFVSLAMSGAGEIGEAVTYAQDNIITQRPKRRERDVTFSIDLQLGDQLGSYTLVIGFGSRGVGHWVVKREECRLGAETGSRQGSEFHSSLDSLGRPISENVLMLSSNFLGGSTFELLINFLTQLEVYSLFPDTLRHGKGVYSPQLLDGTGTNFASVLYNIVENSEWEKDLSQALALIIPGVDVHDPLFIDKSHDGSISIYIKHSGDNVLSLSKESDGTIRALGLLTAIYQTSHPSLMGIEEPEWLIHPGALGVLTDQIRAASHRGQIILTTHSPDLISRFPAESLRIVELVDGVTKIGPLREDQRKIIEDQLFSSGDLLRIEGLSRRG